MLRRIRRLPSPAMVIALVALFVALGGPAQAQRLIGGEDVRNRSLSSVDLKRSTIKFLRATPANSVGSRQIIDGQVLARDLGRGAVTSVAVADGSLTGVDLADGAIGAAQLAPGAVTASRVAAGAVSGAAIADGSLQTIDVGSFAGAVEIDFNEFSGPNVCQAAEAPAASASGGQVDIRDDVVLVTPPPGWSDFLVVTGKPGATPGAIRIVACYVAPAGGSAPDPGPATFRYVTFDSP